MLIEFLQGSLAACGVGVAAYVGYAVGRRTTEEAEVADAMALEEARREGYAAGSADAERRCDDMYGADWDNGYNAGLEVGRASTDPDPLVLTTYATHVRTARLPWIHHQTKDYSDTYRAVIWRLVEVARDVGERYRKVEHLSKEGLVPIGDALNVCIYIADIVQQYNDTKVLSRPHIGMWEGKAS